MARLTGGMWGRPRGKVGQVVYSLALGRHGLEGTVREYNPNPYNPNTAGQKANRKKFGACTNLITLLQASIYSPHWNYRVGGLSGFQSLMSYLWDNISLVGVPPADVPTLDDAADWLQISLGAAYTPVFTWAALGAGLIQVEWTVDNAPINSDDDDTIWAFVARKTFSGLFPPATGYLIAGTSARSDGAVGYEFNVGQESEDYLAGAYAVHTLESGRQIASLLTIADITSGA
jgi:hypothetical protein